MENIFIDLGDSVGVSEDSLFFNGEENLLSESETLVGPQGPPGPQGQKGDPGRDGVDGAAATISVGTTTTGQPGTDAVVVNSGTENAAVLNFTIPRGEQGIQGNQGETGAAGADGAAATITVGSVQTVAADYPATVTNSGTTSAAILEFEIPQGIQGVPGQDGSDGYSPTASVSKVGDTATITITDENGTTTASISDGQDGAAGTPGQAATITVGSTTTGNAGTNASVTNSGTSSEAVFDFVIPRGADGQDGQDGTPGAAATINVGTTTTGAAGTNASVTNSGTSSAAVLNFTIPRGSTGETGPQGPTGPTGQGAIPDWANMEQILQSDKTSGTFSYTATAPGLLYLSHAAANSRTFLDIKVTPAGSSTETRIATFATNPASPNSQGTTTIALNTGDKITTSTLSTNIFITTSTKFVPYK